MWWHVVWGKIFGADVWPGFWWGWRWVDVGAGWHESSSVMPDNSSCARAILTFHKPSRPMIVPGLPHVLLCGLMMLAGDGWAGESAARWSWQESHATVLPTGDLEWAPRPFQFQPGDSVRYIDFDQGSDRADGLTRETPWKHHPWDPEAAGEARRCRGVHTYVFKQGVVYRGQLEAAESGQPGAPVILTRDPAWGEGDAVLSGAEIVEGWKLGADHKSIPEGDKVWFVDLDWVPRNVWMVHGEGGVKRVHLARTPNWEVSDPDDIQSEWWMWTNPAKPFDNYAEINGQKRHMAFDPKHINGQRPQDYYEGAIVWTTKGWVMGTPYPARVLAVDRDNGSLVFPGQWGGGPSYKIIRGCRYYLEDKPHYLDSAGEFWFDRKGERGRLYVRLPGDADPNASRVEVARRIRVIDSRGMSHVRVSGLTFRFTNVYRNPVAAPYWVSKENIDVEPGCVRLLGSGSDIAVTHCRFEHVHRGVRMKAVGPEDVIDAVTVEDCAFVDMDHGGVEFEDGTVYSALQPPMGRMLDVAVRRSLFERVGLRPDLFGQGEALVVSYAETVEVAGNIFNRVYAQGVDVHGSKQSRAATHRPFTRILIHHNRAVDTMLNTDDFGGIETWQGGPAYVYGNVSGNPGGYRHWDHVLSPDTEDRFGHAYYMDGAFKNYYFNNIAWGKSKGPSGRLANTSAFQQIISYENSIFNNTLYNFVRGSRRQAPQAGRDKFLGNIWESMGLRVFRDADPARSAASGNEADAGPNRNDFAIETDAYARNAFYDTGSSFGVFEPSGRWHATLKDFQRALAAYQPMASSVGELSGKSLLLDAAAHDFRPVKNTVAKDLGARVFVPWSLYETVAEWHFYPIPATPDRILDEHWCMASYYTTRDDYYRFPSYPLRTVNMGLADFVSGPLENWTTGALRFNGRDQYAVLSDEQIEKGVVLEVGSGASAVRKSIEGDELVNPQIHRSNFLVEAVFKAGAGAMPAVLVQKLDQQGWALRLTESGRALFMLRSGSLERGISSNSDLRDGEWHHVLAECDRAAEVLRVYVDGRLAAEGAGFGAGVSLNNPADLYVGGTPDGMGLAGELEFVRLARGTLADAKTSIEELYAWEFDGPFLNDFAGRRRPPGGGYAGAISE